MEGERRRLLAPSARPTRTLDIGGSAWSVLVLAKRAHGINRIVRMAVLVHARTFGLIEPAPPMRRNRLSLEGPLIQAVLAWARRTSRVFD